MGDYITPETYLVIFAIPVAGAASEITTVFVLLYVMSTGVAGLISLGEADPVLTNTSTRTSLSPRL